MNRHLESNEVDALICGEELDQARMEHLRNCISCRKEIESFRAIVDTAAVEMEAGMPEIETQIEAVLRRIAPIEDAEEPAARSLSRKGIRRALLLAAATLLLVLGGLRLRPGVRIAAQPTPLPGLKIEEILSTTDALLADNSIPGFESLDSLNDADIDSLLESQDS